MFILSKKHNNILMSDVFESQLKIVHSNFKVTSA